MQQARAAGVTIRQYIEERNRRCGAHHAHHAHHRQHHPLAIHPGGASANGHAHTNSSGNGNGGGASPYKLFFFTSPYLRSLQTYENMSAAFEPDTIMGAQEEVQLREQVRARDLGPLRRPCFMRRWPSGAHGAAMMREAGRG